MLNVFIALLTGFGVFVLAYGLLYLIVMDVERRADVDQ